MITITEKHCPSNKMEQHLLFLLNYDLFICTSATTIVKYLINGEKESIALDDKVSYAINQFCCSVVFFSRIVTFLFAIAIL